MVESRKYYLTSTEEFLGTVIPLTFRDARTPVQLIFIFLWACHLRIFLSLFFFPPQQRRQLPGGTEPQNKTRWKINSSPHSRLGVLVMIPDLVCIRIDPIDWSSIRCSSSRRNCLSRLLQSISYSLWTGLCSGLFSTVTKKSAGNCAQNPSWAQCNSHVSRFNHKTRWDVTCCSSISE